MRFMHENSAEKKIIQLKDNEKCQGCYVTPKFSTGCSRLILKGILMRNQRNGGQKNSANFAKLLSKTSLKNVIELQGQQCLNIQRLYVNYVIFKR